MDSDNTQLTADTADLTVRPEDSMKMEITSNTNEPFSKPKRYTKKEKAKIVENIKSDLLEGQPLQAIALRRSLTMDMLRKVFTDLMRDEQFRKNLNPPTYEVVTAGMPINKIPFFEWNDVDFVHITQADGGIFIKPFTLEDKNI